ncbi:histidine phosphatase family protein [Nonomuraea sp. NPDC046802]|uniref:histidine phosphatase family protein n=1 Tax=Nonomuraea sp. NPDC046802 TaxID=3154919 RepID=UPI0033CC3022
MTIFRTRFVLELVPHTSSMPRTGWVGDHDLRPLSERGRRQADALVTAIGTDVDAVFSSPALRCRQTVAPLAEAAGHTVECLDTLAETERSPQPPDWADGVLAPMAEPLGGAWSAGRMMRAMAIMSGRHEGGRVVAASHGDSIPLVLTTLCALFDVPLPPAIDRGGWYTIRLDQGRATVTAHPGEPA